jgi:hypothetical protein
MGFLVLQINSGCEIKFWCKQGFNIGFWYMDRYNSGLYRILGFQRKGIQVCVCIYTVYVSMCVKQITIELCKFNLKQGCTVIYVAESLMNELLNFLETVPCIWSDWNFLLILNMHQDLAVYNPFCMYVFCENFVQNLGCICGSIWVAKIH